MGNIEGLASFRNLMKNIDTEDEATVGHLFPSTFHCTNPPNIMLQYKFLLMSGHFWNMSEQILTCADMCPNTFQSSFHALLMDGILHNLYYYY